MLVLTRKLGQVIVLGTGPTAITVKITRIDGSQVRLGVTAPRCVRVDREEVAERRRQERKQP
jgi:carbon storage regulator